MTAVLGLLLAGCGASAPGSTATGAVASDACPHDPVPVVVSIDPWTDLAATLGGACARLTTILVSAPGDPHDYEPSTADAARFGDARVVVVNGAGYDAWAAHLLDALDPRPQVVDAARLAEVPEGGDPHLWYDPGIVHAMGPALTAALSAAAPELAGYFAGRTAVWQERLRPYDAAVRDLRASAQGRTYAATEPVFDRMAAALEMRDVTPEGWRRAAAGEGEPAPGDVLAMQQLLADRAADVLIVNSQTESATTSTVQEAAHAAGVPVVTVTETVPAGADSFVGWQVGQLTALQVALGAG